MLHLCLVPRSAAFTRPGARGENRLAGRRVHRYRPDDRAGDRGGGTR